MKIGDALSLLGRAQRTKRFKVIATALVIAIGVGAFGAWALWINAPAGSETPAVQQPTASTEEGLEPSQDGVVAEAEDRVIERVDFSVLRDMLGSRDATLGVGVGMAIAIGLACVVIWLNVGLTYLGIAAAIALLAAPLFAFGSTQSLGRLVVGFGALTASFAIVLESLRLALGARTPTCAVARNVLNEAVRMKISVVFIVMLIFLLATLPNLLDSSQPLRFRVQSFLQYGIAGTFWVLALLTLFFSVATVAFEQRDRVIWQTMSKPVAPWEYLAGKWLGVMSVNAALLAVSASGVFLFTEYLRSQPAIGEVRPYVNASGVDAPTQDRLLLESQVLVARDSRRPSLPPIDMNAVRQAVEQRLSEAINRGELQDDRRAQYAREIQSEVLTEADSIRRSIPPGMGREFTFEDLQGAKKRGRPVTLRYTIQAGSNDPTQLYRVALIVAGEPIVREAPLNIAQTLAIRPEAIDDNGTITVEVLNGDPGMGMVNPLTMTFPPDGLEILYVAGGYELNFIRVMSALWVKLAFIAAVGVASATFLSFPVACCLTFLLLFAAETSGYLKGSLDVYFGLRDEKPALLNAFVAAIAKPIAYGFSTYAELNPSRTLVEGRLLSWGGATVRVLLVLAWSVGVLAIGWSIFRKRELAIYSGT